MENLDDTLVLDRTRQWTKIDTTVAVKRMLEEQGDAIRNFPDDDDLSGSVDRNCIDQIDREFEKDMHLDPELISSLKDHGICQTTKTKMMLASPFFVKLTDLISV